MAAPALLVLLFAVGCSSSTSSKPDDTPAEQTTQQADEAASRAQPDAKRYVEDAASWFAADTYAVGAVTAEQYWSFGARFFPEGRRSLDDDAPGTAGGLKSDLSAMMLDRVGVDLTGLEGAAFGLGHDSRSIVLFGEIELADDRLERSDIDGTEVLELRVDGQNAWLVRFEKPRKGIAVFYEKDFLRHALEARATQTEADDDLTSARANVDMPLFEDLPAGNFVAVAKIDDRLAKKLGGMPFPPPDRLGFSFGDDVTVLMEGPAASLDGVSRFVSQYRAMAEGQVERLQRRADTSDTPEAIGSLIGYHYAYAYLETFEQERTEGRLRYSMAAPDTGLAMMGPGVLAAIAIPAFIKYIKRSKASEAQAILRRMSNGAKAYFTSEQIGCRGKAHCWHPSTQMGLPVQFKNYVFPGGTNVHVVSMADPPREGEKRQPKPALGPGHRAKVKDVAPVLDALNVSFQDPAYFQYVYKTGPGRGPDATAKISAEADFDGNGEPNHRVEVHLKIDPNTQEVVVMPAVTFNEFE